MIPNSWILKTRDFEGVGLAVKDAEYFPQIFHSSIYLVIFQVGTKRLTFPVAHTTVSDMKESRYLIVVHWRIMMMCVRDITKVAAFGPNCEQ